MKHFSTSLKAMLSVLMLCWAIGIQAGDVTFNGATDTNGKAEAGADQLTKNGVTLSVSNGLLASGDGQYRTYKGQTLTITSTVGAITKVVFTCTAKDDAKYGPGCFTVASGEYTYEGNTGTWTGAATEVVFTAATNQVRATEIVVTVDGNTPVDPDPGPGPDPTPTDAFTSIAAMKTAATAEKADAAYQFKDLLVTYVNGVYNFVSDGTDGFLFYGATELVAGDKITGFVKGKLYQYNGLTEMSDNTFTVESKTSGNTVTAQTVAVEDILSDYRNYESEYVKISGVTFNGAFANGVTVSQNGSDLALYNRFGYSYDVDTTHKYDIYGFPAIFKETIQLYVTEIVDQDGSTPGPGPEPTGSTVFESTFLDSDGGFTVNDVSKPEGLEYVWANSSRYGWKASAFVDKVAYATESWLISPAIALPADPATLTFDHVSRFTENASTQLTLWISTDKSAWTQLQIPTYSSGADWTYVSCGEIDLSAFAGKTVYIGFKYLSTEAEASTWEIKNFVISTEGSTPGPQPSSDVIYENSLLGDEGNFTINDVALSEGLTFVWSNTSNYGWKASAFANGGNHASDSWLISPAFTLGKEQSSIKFEHARKFGEQSHLSVNISTDKQNWTSLELSAWPDGSSWDYVEATADLSAFAGKTVYIGFHYTSTDAAAATWEIKNFSVTSPGGSCSGEEPGPQPEPNVYTSLAAAKTAATADKTASVMKLENVLVTYVNGLSTYLADEENGFLLYGNVENVAAGDVVNIEVAGDLFLYNGMPELSVTEVKAVTTISSGNAVTPVALEVADVVADPFKYSNMLVSFEGVNFLEEAFNNRNVTITQDGEELVVRDNWKSMTDESIKFSLSDTYTVTGFVAMFKEAPQIYPRDINDIVSTSAIRGVELDAAKTSIYNLAGQKMENITRGGLYIVNGKKVLVK